MKILLTFPRPLVPADSGGKIRSLHIFSRLAERAEVHAVSLADPERDAEGVREMQRMFASYTPVFWRESKKYSPRFYAELLANQLSPLPYFVAKCCRPKFTQALRALSQSHRFDLLCCDFLQTATSALDLPMRPRVVFEHNVESLLRRRLWQAETMPLKRRIFAAEWKKTLKLEARICRSFDHVVAVSEEDRRTFAREFGFTHVSAIPTGVDAEYFRPQQASPQPGRLVFVGAMDWYPNEDGVVWFLREVFPRIRQVIPHVWFKIVGQNPSLRLRRIAEGSPAVELMGRVADVRPHVAEAEVVVVPLRVGGGTRIKIPEAMAMGKAVVSTHIGAEGLPFRNGSEIHLEDDPEAFSLAVIELLQNPNRRTVIEKAARERVVRDHSWESVVDRLEEILVRVKDDGRAAAFTSVQTQLAAES
jgi:sugar transferase (PEP-CTERM/EpsH1 system associated)